RRVLFRSRPGSRHSARPGRVLPLVCRRSERNTPMTRVLILGGGGMLGHKAWQVFRAQGGDVFVTFRHFDERLRATAVFEDSRVIPAVDAWKFDSIRGAIAQARPDSVLNCIGIIKQRE